MNTGSLSRRNMVARYLNSEPGRLAFILMLPDGEQDAVVLGVDLSVGSERKGCVGGSQRLVQEDPAYQAAALPEHIQAAVFAVGINISGQVDRRRVNAPFKAVVVRGVGGGVLELPVDIHVGVELGDVVGTFGGRYADLLRYFDSLDGETIIGSVIMVVLDDDRVGAVVRVNRRRGIPPEMIGGHENPVGIEVEEVTPLEVIYVIGAVNDSAVGSHYGRGGGLIDDAPGRLVIGGGIYAEVRAVAAGIRLRRVRRRDRNQHAAAIVQMASQRGSPLQRQVGVECHDVGIPAREGIVRHGNRIDGSIRRNRGSDVYAGTLGKAGDRSRRGCRTGRPRQLFGIESGKAHRGRRRIEDQVFVTDFIDGSRARDLYQPGIWNVYSVGAVEVRAERPRIICGGIIGNVQLQDVVVDVPLGVHGDGR